MEKMDEQYALQECQDKKYFAKHTQTEYVFQVNG